MCTLLQAELLRVEQQLALFQAAMDAAEEGAAALRSANAALAASEARAAADAAGGTAEARRLAAQVRGAGQRRARYRVAPVLRALRSRSMSQALAVMTQHFMRGPQHANTRPACVSTVD